MPINLLPVEELQSKQVRKVGNGLKMLAAFFGIICLTVAIAGTILVITKNKSVEALSAKQSDLKSLVLAQESSEQTLIFLRDRLNKLKEIQTKHPNNNTFLSYKTLSENFPENVSLKRLDLEQHQPAFSLSVENSQALSEVINQIKQSPFSLSIIKNISLNPTGDFQLSIISQ